MQDIHFVGKLLTVKHVQKFFLMIIVVMMSVHRTQSICVLLSPPVFTRESSYCFQRVLAIAILSVRLSVRLSFTHVDQSKTVQARIAKSLLSAAWKTLVSETVKLIHKFKGVTPNEGTK